MLQCTCTKHCDAPEVRKEFFQYVMGIAVCQLPDKLFVRLYIRIQDKYRVYHYARYRVICSFQIGE
jgi:hypothetical protein